MIRFRTAIAAAVVALSAFTAAPAGAETFDEAQRRAIEAIVRDTLTKNPEIVMEAIEALQAREKQVAEDRARAALTTHAKALYEDPASPVAGNAKGDVTVVEFFDYQCGYCKAVQADVQALIKQDGKLRFVFKEFPILGPGSLVAAKAALAARNQGKYLEMHEALMSHRGQLDQDTVLRLARSAGLDTERLKADMESEPVEAALRANHELAEALGIRGTPGFVFGGTIVPGAVKLDEMKRLVASARKG